MLYHFPEESPEELLEKERLLLEEQIRNAKRVETHGYRKAELTLPSSFIEWRCIEEYLQCPIEKWKRPTSWRDKVELEPLPTEFLPPLKPHKRLTYYDTELRENVERVVGYREILQKREYVQYLKDLETIFDDSGEDEELGGEEGSVATPQSLFLSRGGAGKGKKEKDGKKKGKETGKEKNKDKGHHDKKKGHDSKPEKEKEDSVTDGLLGLIRKSQAVGKMGFIEKLIKKQHKHKKNEEAKQATKLETTAAGNLTAKKKIGKHGKKLTQKQLKQLEFQRRLEEILKWISKIKVTPRKERDYEWLNLSNTDPEEETKVISSFEKEKKTWMLDGISFESQFLAHTFRWYHVVAKWSGRSFVNIHPDYEKKHMEFTHRKRDVAFFFLTSILFWICFCLMTVSFILITWENQGITDVQNNQRQFEDADDLLRFVTVARHEVEELELKKYHIPLFIVLVNLILVSVWSILVILGDGIFLAHYFNCWCAALAEMETSGCLDIKKELISSYVWIVFYACVVSGLFYIDYPAHVRQSNGLIAALIVRPVKPDLRINTERKLLPFQIAGLIFQIYVVYCATMIKLLMRILAIILKNASEMWNFKFALTFDQLGTKNRGQLQRLALNHSLLKLFTHHRILTVLLRNFGEVFVIPIMIYMICEMGEMTLTMVRVFFYKGSSKEEYDGEEGVIISTENPIEKLGEEAEIIIPYYHTPTEVYLTYGLVIFQLIVQYLITSEVLAKAGTSFFAGYEFVRRSGTILCRNSHQRRLIQSLEWSFSSTNPSVLSANSYFAINRATIFSAFAAVVGFFSLIIQLRVQETTNTIKFLSPEDCKIVPDFELVKGACVPLRAAGLEDQSIGFGL